VGAAPTSTIWHLVGFFDGKSHHSSGWIEGRVLFTRYVGFGELLAWYRTADVFVLPSRSEPPDVDGFPGVFLEAGACGLPTIGSNEGGTEDAVLEGRTGLLVPSNDPGALAKAMTRLASSPSLREVLGRCARDRAGSDASWDNVAQRIWLTMQILSDPAPAATEACP
jgi:phosphatidylinositol alpha-1,6-mannosyltransferase